ncbi:MAG: flavodoxin [Bacilli bacterium]
MKKIAVIYWSGTGNTEAMADAVAMGIEEKGASADLIAVDSFDVSTISTYDAFAFGCPSMGSEVLEESEFQPMWDDIISELIGKSVILFGSYDWGDGEWMQEWEESCGDLGIEVIDTLTCNLTPDDDDLSKCSELGKKLIR